MLRDFALRLPGCSGAVSGTHPGDQLAPEVTMVEIGD